MSSSAQSPPSPSNERHWCNYDSCSKSYSRKDGLTRHVNNEHLHLSQKSCPRCGKGFRNNDGLILHSVKFHNIGRQGAIHQSNPQWIPKATADSSSQQRYSMNKLPSSPRILLLERTTPKSSTEVPHHRHRQHGTPPCRAQHLQIAGSHHLQLKTLRIKQKSFHSRT